MCTAVVYNNKRIRFHPIDASADSLHAHPNSKQCATLIFHQVARVRLICCAGLGVRPGGPAFAHISPLVAVLGGDGQISIYRLGPGIITGEIQ